jgi:alanine racemase
VALVKRVAAGEGVGYGLTFRPRTDTDVALIPVGYGDGVFRLLGNRGQVVIGGRRYPMVGRVSMDSFGVDVGTDCRVRTGYPVTLIGQEGTGRVSA